MGHSATPSRALVSALQTILPPLLNLTRHPRSLVQLIMQSLTPSLPPASSSTYYIDDTPSDSQHTWPKPDSSSSTPSSSSLGSGLSISLKAASINAASLAILDAGSIEMTGIPIAVSLAQVDGAIVVDPSIEEEGRSESRFGFGWVFGVGYGKNGENSDVGDVKMEEDGEAMSVGCELVWVECEGSFTREQVGQSSVSHPSSCLPGWNKRRSSRDEADHGITQFNQAMSQSQQAARRILRYMEEKLEESLNPQKAKRELMH